MKNLEHDNRVPAGKELLKFNPGRFPSAPTCSASRNRFEFEICLKRSFRPEVM